MVTVVQCAVLIAPYPSPARGEGMVTVVQCAPHIALCPSPEGGEGMITVDDGTSPIVSIVCYLR